MSIQLFTGKIFEDIKLEKIEDENIKPKVKKNVMKIESDDEDEADDVKPPLTDISHIRDTGHSEQSVADLVKDNSENLLFIQLPDHLPGAQLTDNKQVKQCHLDSLPEGLVGKLVIRKSGACQLSLGGQLMNVDMGTKVGFLQDVMSIQLPQQTDASSDEKGSMTVLGHVTQRLVVTPDWEHLMDTSGLCSTLA